MDKQLFKNIRWAFIAQVGYIFVAFLGLLVLTRMLTPQDFGIIGVAMFFVEISNVLIEGGMGGALVRKKNATKNDFSTIFVFNLLVSLTFFILLLIFSNYIAKSYKQPSLEIILPILGLIMIINAFTITQNARLVKQMKFKMRGMYKLVSVTLSSIIAVILAKLDYGVWAIVALQVLTSFFYMLILNIIYYKEFSLNFSKESFKEMYSFGVFTTLSSLLSSVFDNIYQLILGKYFSITQVGYYYQAKKLQDAPDTVFKLIILQVFYSHLSKIQDEKAKFNLSFNNLGKLTAIFLGISTSLIFIYSNEIVLLFFGLKWLDSVFYLKILVIVSFFNLLEMFNRNIFKVFDLTHKIFFLELVKKSIQSLSIIVGLFFEDITILLIGFSISSMLSFLINLYYTNDIINNPFKEQFLIILKIICSAIVTTMMMLYFIEKIDFSGYLSFILMPVFFTTFFLLLHMFQVENIVFIFKKYIIKER